MKSAILLGSQCRFNTGSKNLSRGDIKRMPPPHPTIIGHTSDGVPIADPREFPATEHLEYLKNHPHCAVGYLAPLRVVDSSGNPLYEIPARTLDGTPLITTNPDAQNVILTKDSDVTIDPNSQHTVLTEDSAVRFNPLPGQKEPPLVWCPTCDGNGFLHSGIRCPKCKGKHLIRQEEVSPP